VVSHPNDGFIIHLMEIRITAQRHDESDEMEMWAVVEEE
jgi:hypothetical protein